MTKQTQNVRKPDFHPIEAIRTALSQGLNRLRIRERRLKFNWWTGSVEGNETTITVEPHDDRH